MKNILVFCGTLILFCSCAFHSGNVSTGSDIDCPRVSFAIGEASTFKFCGIGGIEKNALILEAKNNLYYANPYKKGLKISNFSADFKNTYFLFLNWTKVTVSADVFDCNFVSNDTLTTQKIELSENSINGFSIGDSLIYINPNSLISEYQTAILNRFLGKEKVLISIPLNKDKAGLRKVHFSDIYKVTKSDVNVYNFGFQVGEILEINVYNFVTEAQTRRSCKIIGINMLNAIIEFQNSYGKTTRQKIAKTLLKK